MYAEQYDITYLIMAVYGRKQT